MAAAAPLLREVFRFFGIGTHEKVAVEGKDGKDEKVEPESQPWVVAVAEALEYIEENCAEHDTLRSILPPSAHEAVEFYVK